MKISEHVNQRLKDTLQKNSPWQENKVKNKERA